MLISNKEKKILDEFNSTRIDYPQDKTIPALFEEQVVKFPDRVAVVVGAADSISLTYRVLNNQADCIAHLLANKGVKQDDIVGLIMEPSLGMIVGILGILKVGAAYLPIDTEYPQERINYMLKDSGAKLLVNEKFFGGFRGAILQKSPPVYSNLAYVMYTSGSTGRPKGVVVTHHNVVRVVRDIDYVCFKESDRVLQSSNYAFDGSVFNIFGALLNGAALVIVVGKGHLAMDKLPALIKREQITMLFLSTALFNTIVDMGVVCFKDVRKVVIGGERASQEHSRKFLAAVGKGKLVNGYGPTETTVFATSYDIDDVPPGTASIPIGKPLANTFIYILDKDLKPAPVGAEGEIYIGGDGCARGYMNNPGLTHDKFIANPFVKGDRLYRSGDLGRLLPDPALPGAYIIEFLGRLDQQVKIRGFRIEPEEIENCLLNHHKVKETAVIARTAASCDKYLCAFVTPKNPLAPKPGANELKEYLSRLLPDYMMPAHFKMLDKLPLNTNGKVDKKWLATLEIGTSNDYKPPANTVERKLVGIWAELLGMEYGKISSEDDFFQLGGHSLKATLLVMEIYKVFNARISVTEVFLMPSVKELARAIEKALPGENYEPVKKVETKEFYPLSSAQERLYVLQQVDPGAVAYNMPLIYTAVGVLDAPRLEKAFKEMIHRHESFRTSFVIVAGYPMQRIHEPDEIEFKIRCFDALSAVLSFPFDLSQAPLLRAGLVRIDKHTHLLVIDQHHIISDGVSLGILTRELGDFYHGRDLPLLTAQYKDYARWQKEFARSTTVKKQENFWLQEFQQGAPLLDLPLDYPRPPVQGFAGDAINFEAPRELVESLKKLAVENGATLFMVLMAVYNVLLFKYTGVQDIIVGVPTAGRMHPDLKNIIGMFVNTLALRNFPQPQDTFLQFLGKVKEKSLAALKNQDYQLEQLIDALGIRRERGRNPLFDTVFVLHNIELGDLQLEGMDLIPYELERKQSTFDISIEGFEKNGAIRFYLEYCTRLFRRETIQRMTIHFLNIMKIIVGAPSSLLTDIDMATPEEKDQVLQQFNIITDGGKYDFE